MVAQTRPNMVRYTKPVIMTTTHWRHHIFLRDLRVSPPPTSDTFPTLRHVHNICSNAALFATGK